MTVAGGDVDMRESYTSYLERSVSGEEMTDALPDIDLYDHDNPLCVTEYVNDIYDYWYRVEVRSSERARRAPTVTTSARGFSTAMRSHHLRRTRRRGDFPYDDARD